MMNCAATSSVALQIWMRAVSKSGWGARRTGGYQHANHSDSNRRRCGTSDGKHRGAYSNNNCDGGSNNGNGGSNSRDSDSDKNSGNRGDSGDGYSGDGYSGQWEEEKEKSIINNYTLGDFDKGGKGGHVR